MTAAPPFRTRPFRLAATLMSVSLLAACASTGEAPTPTTPDASAARAAALAELKQRPVPDEPISKAAYWAQRAELEPRDVGVSVQFAKALRGMNSNDRAVEFLEERLVVQPSEADLVAEYGKSLLAAGRALEAIPVLQRARQMKSDDWTIPMAEGIAYDQIRDYSRARQAYQAALAISPDNPVILNNLGLSYLAAGDRANAARYLRMAAAAPGADARIRANLDLVADVPVAAAPQPAAAPAQPERTIRTSAPAEPAPPAKAPAAAPKKTEPAEPPPDLRGSRGLD